MKDKNRFFEAELRMSWVILTFATSITLLLDAVDGSIGDRSWFYQKTVRHCFTENCTNQAAFLQDHPIHLRLLGWSCLDECKYETMWLTVDAFKRDGSGVPQFHGKWPFIRVLGIQEPASAFFSVLNAAAHLGIFTYRRRVPPSAQMYYVWHGASLVAFNAWFWSTVFHTRDTDFTEKMDYFFAFSIVLYNVFTFVCRTLGTKVKWRPAVTGIVLLVFFIQHISYLSFVKFDYGYNMKVNLSVGCVNLVAWLVWSLVKIRKQRYLWKCVAVVVGLNVLLMLELLDFPPIWWVFDAHSLWHAGTVPLGLLWYGFIIDDSLYVAYKLD